HGPSLVNISTLQHVRSARFPAASDDTPGDLRGLPFEETPESDGTSLGSGLIISSDGYILTCAHVVEDAREIVVRLFDRREFNARLVGSDSRSDVALLKIDAGSLAAVAIGNPSKLEVGEWVLAIGSPFGFN